MTNENPYSAPQASLDGVAPSVPAGITRKIIAGWVVTLICGLSTLVLVLSGMSRPGGIINSEAWSLVDVALMFGLALGIYKKSRTCAVIMLLYFALGKLAPVITHGSPIGIVVAILFLFALLQGMVGSFAFHKYLKESLAAAPG